MTFFFQHYLCLLNSITDGKKAKVISDTYILGMQSCTKYCVIVQAYPHKQMLLLVHLRCELAGYKPVLGQKLQNHVIWFIILD